MFKLNHEGLLPRIEPHNPRRRKAKIRLDLGIQTFEEAFFGRKDQGQKSLRGPIAVCHVESFELMREADVLLQGEVFRGQNDLTVNTDTLVMGS